MSKHLQDLPAKATRDHKFYIAWGILSLALLALPITALAQASKPLPKGKAKSSFNTQVYSKDEDTETFTDQVHFVREMAGEYQVKFKAKPGIYRIPEGNESLQNRLVKAQKSQLSVAIKAEKDNHLIQEVTLEGM